MKNLGLNHSKCLFVLNRVEILQKTREDYETGCIYYFKGTWVKNIKLFYRNFMQQHAMSIVIIYHAITYTHTTHM